MPADYIIDPSLSPSGNRYQSFTALATALGSNKNRTTVNLGRATEIQIDTNLTENYDWSSWTTDAINSLLIYGASRAVEWRRSGTYATACNMSGKHIVVRGLTFNGQGTTAGTDAGIKGLILSGFGKVELCIIKGWVNDTTTGNARGVGCQMSSAEGTGGKLAFNTFINCGDAVNFSKYIANKIINNAIGKCRRGLHQIDTGSGSSTIVGNAICGSSIANWSNVSGSVSLARNNAGETGDTIPDTVGSTTITITSSEFVDYSGDNLHITSTSKLRHTHASYPTGNNQQSGYTLDVDGETLPASYSTDADRWDTGSDFYVLVVLGTAYYRDTNLTAVSDAASIKRVSDDAAFTFADMVAEDTLQVKAGAVVEFKDNGSIAYNFLKGIQLDIQNGEVKFTNALTTKGQSFFGIKSGFLKVGSQGKFTVRGTLCLIADLSGGSYSSVRDLDNAEWDTMFGTGTKDSLTKYGEPAVLFVGPNTGSLLPYYNKGSGTTIGDVANDTTHGRFFRFDQANGNITWPDLVPATTQKVYCYNIMLHCQNGGGTPVQSFGFDTTAKGAVDIENMYFTGNPSFKDASACRLAGLGVIQPLTVDHCSGVVLDAYQAVSQANEQTGTCTIKNLKGQASLGKVGAVGPGTVIKLQNLRSSIFSTVYAEGFGAQTSGAYRVIIDGTDECDFGTVEVIDGGVSFENKISINPRIRVLNHSNDQSGSNGNNSQHVLFGASTGTRGLKVDQVNLLANGFPTALDLFNVANAGVARFLSITYNAVIRNIISTEDCFDIMVSSAVISRCTTQAWKALGTNSQIVLQGIRNTASPSSPPAFVEWSTGTEDVIFKNVPYETSDRYSGWALPITDANFQELNLGNGSTGKLVLNFSQNTKSAFTFTGLAKSDNAATVLLPAVSDRVEVEWPYDILVGSASPYFSTTAMVTTGTNTGNLTFEYAVNINGAGYGSWTTLTAAALNALSITTKFRLKFRVTCATASATNAIKQIVLSTNIDSTVVYPSSLVSVKLSGVVVGSSYQIFRGSSEADGKDSAKLIASGTAATGSFNIDSVPYSGDETISIRLRKSSTGSNPDYLPYEIQAILADTGATVVAQQTLDSIST